MEKKDWKNVLANLTAAGQGSDQTLKLATLSFIAAQLLSKEEKDSLTKVFKAFDRDNDGKLSIEELQNGYAEQGNKISTEEIQKMFDLVDSDHSGFIDYSEFVVAAISDKALTSPEKL